jgi:RNA polymerase sigma-70 factor (TIGR02960 family)
MTAPESNPREFEARIAPYRTELHAYCYRMLGSLQDAEDALQEALLGAWRGLPRFEERSALRSWLFAIATNACLRLLAQRPKRLLAADYSSPASGTDLDAIVEDPVWLEPYPSDPGSAFEVLESVELAFVAALQRLPGTQRAVLILREVLGFEATEAASVLDTTVASVNSALRRGRRASGCRSPRRASSVSFKVKTPSRITSTRRRRARPLFCT